MVCVGCDGAVWAGGERRAAHRGRRGIRRGLIVGEGLRAVAAFDGAIELLVGAEEYGWPEERVVEGAEGGVRKLGAGVEDGLGELLDLHSLDDGRVCGPGVVVVDESVGIA